MMAVLAMAGAQVEAGDTAPDPVNPRVHVVGGRLLVDQEPVRFFKAHGKVRITWRLPANGPWTFAPDGIVVESAGTNTGADVRSEFSCAIHANPRLYSCENRNSQRGTYKYTVRVLENQKLLEPLDPFVVNDM